MSMLQSRWNFWILKWCGTLLLPIPVALLITRSLVVPNPDWWGGVNSWLFHFYNSVCLHGVLYIFSWSWMTVFMIQSALPYMVGCNRHCDSALSVDIQVFQTSDRSGWSFCCSAAMRKV